MAADSPYGEFYDFYSVSPEYFGHTLVCRLTYCVFLRKTLNFRKLFFVSHDAKDLEIIVLDLVD
jgi:hypothetical protein